MAYQWMNPADVTGRYAPADACFVGEKLTEHENEPMAPESSSGYFRMAETTVCQLVSFWSKTPKTRKSCKPASLTYGVKH